MSQILDTSKYINPLKNLSDDILQKIIIQKAVIIDNRHKNNMSKPIDETISQSNSQDIFI